MRAILRDLKGDYTLSREISSAHAQTIQCRFLVAHTGCAKNALLKVKLKYFYGNARLSIK